MMDLGVTATVLWLAINCYHECRYEPVAGQVAVAQVVLNRASKCEAPVKDVILAEKQFSWTGYSERKILLFSPLKDDEVNAFQTCLETSFLATVTPDLTNGATHYHADYVSPSWASKMKHVVTIGHHLFYRGEEFRCSKSKFYRDGR
jgi:N-acetylmuramoyl-L-alanine amidase